METKLHSFYHLFANLFIPLTVVLCTLPPVLCQEKLPQNPKAGDRFVLKIKGVDFAFRYCPAGTFMMGSPANEKNRGKDEPQHEVQLTKGFWLGETEVTQEQWTSITGVNPSKFNGEKLPVENVSWNDCRTYIKQLNGLNATPAGFGFALPTEAQWEYACRAGTTTAYCFGDDSGKLADYAWYKNGGKKNKTHDAGTKKANAWGLYDMHGNVWEWCSDWSGDYPKEKVTDPAGVSYGVHRTGRGGGFDFAAGHCRSAHRGSDAPEFRYEGLGLRLVLVKN